MSQGHTYPTTASPALRATAVAATTATPQKKKPTSDSSASLSPPLLTLNGLPITAPSSAAFPPTSPYKKRRQSHRTSSITANMPSSKLKPSASGLQQGATSTRRRSKPISSTLNHMPNPILHPQTFLSFLVWRMYLWFGATFVLSMLTDAEVFLLTIVTTLLTCVIAYSLFFHLPNHLENIIARASYYIFGSEAL